MAPPSPPPAVHVRLHPSRSCSGSPLQLWPPSAALVRPQRRRGSGGSTAEEAGRRLRPAAPVLLVSSRPEGGVRVLAAVLLGAPPHRCRRGEELRLSGASWSCCLDYLLIPANGAQIPAGAACFFPGNVPDGRRNPGRDFCGIDITELVPAAPPGGVGACLNVPPAAGCWMSER